MKEFKQNIKDENQEEVTQIKIGEYQDIDEFIDEEILKKDFAISKDLIQYTILLLEDSAEIAREKIEEDYSDLDYDLERQKLNGLCEVVLKTLKNHNADLISETEAMSIVQAGYKKLIKWLDYDIMICYNCKRRNRDWDNEVLSGCSHCDISYVD